MAIRFLARIVLLPVIGHYLIAVKLDLKVNEELDEPDTGIGIKAQKPTRSF